MSEMIRATHELHQFAEKVRRLIHEHPDLEPAEKWAEVEKEYKALLKRLRPDDFE